MVLHTDLKPIKINPVGVNPVRIIKLKKELELEQDIVNNRIRRGNNNNNTRRRRKEKFQKD